MKTQLTRLARLERKRAATEPRIDTFYVYSGDELINTYKLVGGQWVEVQSEADDQGENSEVGAPEAGSLEG